MGTKEVILEGEQLRKLQLIQLDMLIEVDRICKKNNIKYNIIAGTLLGAVRHGGYIPWDDDADIAMLRSEYEKFFEVIKKDLDTTKYYFQEYRNTDGYRWGYGKLRRKGTEFIRSGQEHMPYESGIFIDIFPLDNVPDNKYIRFLHNIHCTLIRKILWSAVGEREEKNFFLRKIYFFLNKIPLKKVFNHYEKFKDKYNSKDCSMVRILTFPTPNKMYGYYKKWYEESKSIIFEAHEFDGIKEYDEYLKFKFNDYMNLPPESERKIHSVSRIKLEVDKY